MPFQQSLHLCPPLLAWLHGATPSLLGLLCGEGPWALLPLRPKSALMPWTGWQVVPRGAKESRMAGEPPGWGCVPPPGAILPPPPASSEQVACPIPKAILEKAGRGRGGGVIPRTDSRDVGGQPRPHRGNCDFSRPLHDLCDLLSKAGTRFLLWNCFLRLLMLLGVSTQPIQRSALISPGSSVQTSKARTTTEAPTSPRLVSSPCVGRQRGGGRASFATKRQRNTPHTPPHTHPAPGLTPLSVPHTHSPVPFGWFGCFLIAGSV